MTTAWVIPVAAAIVIALTSFRTPAQRRGSGRVYETLQVSPHPTRVALNPSPARRGTFFDYMCSKDLHLFVHPSGQLRRL
ncbi:MAG: hypothetical protein U0X91_22235 [Spirosomataceae bacterium]